MQLTPEKLGEWADAYRFGVGVHGFPLPDIKIWNAYVGHINQQIKDVFNFKGSVEDLPSGKCEDCGSGLIRVLDTSNPLFSRGIIYCPSPIESHPKDYWIEIWPDANWVPGQRYMDRWGMPEKQVEIDKWRLSDPRIRKCYYRLAFEIHPYFESMLKEDFPEHKVRPLPRPAYIHPKGDPKS